MINRLKRKFTVLATVSMLVLMTVLLLIMNGINYSSVVTDSDAVLQLLSGDTMQDMDKIEPPDVPTDEKEEEKDIFLLRGMSPEVPYESRYFSILLDAQGQIEKSDLSKIISVDENSMEDYIKEAYESGRNKGFIGHFRFLKTESGGKTKILFLDCGRKLDAFYTFLLISTIVGLGGCVAVFVFFLFAAGRIVNPIAESYEKQKRFISDAGHEIKTPLTIINANVDLLECDMEREELTDIKQQTKRLTKLTNNLVYLSKMEESEHKLQKIDMPLSDVVSETAGNFRAPAAANQISFKADIAPDITASGSPDAISQLVSILLENAVKYSPEGGVITLSLSANKKNAVLSVFNTTATRVEEKELPHIFDRFYRTDTSRNSQTGGHGIGLSIAKAIADAHGGSITATTKTGNDFCITVTLPV